MFKKSFVNGVLKNAFATVVVLFVLQSSIAQSTYGIIAGAGKTSLYKFPFSPEDFDRYNAAGSFWGGFTADFPLSHNGISLFSSATFSKKGYKYLYQTKTGTNNSIKDSAFTQNLKYADLNITLRKSLSMSETGNFFVGTGPGLSFFTGGNEKITVNYFGSMVPSKNNTKTSLTVGNAAGTYQRAFFNWGFDAGFDFGNFSAWLHAGIPLNPFYRDPSLSVPHKIKVIGINASYTLFTLIKREKKEKPLPEPPAKIVVEDSLADSDGDGIIDREDRCPGHKGVAKYFGCPVPDTDGDGVDDDADRCPTVSGPVTNNGCPVFTDTVKTATKDTTFFTIYFEQAKSVLRTDAYNKLNEVVKMLKANSKLVVLFKGHTDFAGSVEANDKRALERAKTCADYIRSFYIDPKRIQYVGYGNRFPAAELTDPLVQWKNRRVEVCVFEVNQ
jgi:outer membrane protein OmpA-like peptidoglycan-associated protein